METQLNIRINGYKSTWDASRPLLTSGLSNHKIAKSEKFKGGKYSTMVLHLAPASISGYNVCPGSSPGCRASCLNMAGHGGATKGEIGNKRLETNSCHVARVGRTALLMKRPDLFFLKLKGEIGIFLAKCGMKGSKPCLRLNGTSDLNWMTLTDPGTNKSLMEIYPEIQFYDYTKVYARLKRSEKFSNYHLTFSLSENNVNKAKKALKAGYNVAAVFSEEGAPEKFLNHPVFSADETDLRFIDNEVYGRKGAFVLSLVEKGYMGRLDTTGFVVRDA